jgi:flagellar assembly protein FliH
MFAAMHAKIKILKADSIVVSPSKSVLSANGDNLHEALPVGMVDGEESEMVIAEAKLAVYKLLNDVKRQAEDLMTQAKEQSKQVLSQAVAESAGIESARESAYQSGREDERMALQNDRKKLIEEQTTFEETIKQERLRMIREIEPDIIELSLRIARKIIHAELKQEPAQIANIAEAVLEQVKESDNVTLKVNADDLATVSGLLADKTRDGARIRFRVDKTLASGDFIAVTPSGMVDGTVEGQLGEIRHRLMEAAENG